MPTSNQPAGQSSGRVSTLRQKLARALIVGGTVWALCAVPAGAQTQRPSGAAPKSDAEVVALTSRSVVEVITEQGSGSAVQIEGGVLTAEHVIVDADRIELLASDGRRASATVVRSDHDSDLALLKTTLVQPSVRLQMARSQRQGDPLLVLGYPRADFFGDGGQATLTRGILSAVREDSRGIVNVQTDAPMNPGNSGGPILNLQGEVVGIAQNGVGRTGSLNFGVASESIEKFLAAPLASLNPTPNFALDEYEPDDEIGQSALLPLDGSIQIRSLYNPGADMDIDAVIMQLQEGDVVQVVVRSSWCTVSMLMGSPESALKASERGDSTIELRADTTGEYVVAITPSFVVFHIVPGEDLNASYDFTGDSTCRRYELSATLLAVGSVDDTYALGDDEAVMTE